MFGKGTLESQDAILDDLQKKIESDNREKDIYTKWYTKHTLQKNKKLPGIYTVSTSALTGAPSLYNTHWSMYYKFTVRHIALPQGNNYTCAFSSFCLAIYAFANENTEI